MIRTSPSGANRDDDVNKLDFEGFLSPLVLHRFAVYMHKNRLLKDGSVRESDNWQKGMPREWYMKSGWRHFFDWWEEHRGIESREGVEEALCGLLFNTMGYLHEVLKEKRNENASEFAADCGEFDKRLAVVERVYPLETNRVVAWDTHGGPSVRIVSCDPGCGDGSASTQSRLA